MRIYCAPLRNREETEALAKAMVNQPAEIIARLKKLLGE
jgi:hypothetical protein